MGFRWINCVNGSRNRHVTIDKVSKVEAVIRSAGSALQRRCRIARFLSSAQILSLIPARDYQQRIRAFSRSYRRGAIDLPRHASESQRYSKTAESQGQREGKG